MDALALMVYSNSFLKMIIPGVSAVVCGRVVTADHDARARGAFSQTFASHIARSIIDLTGTIF